MNQKIRKVLAGIRRAPIYVVAAIEGDALGGGCELVLACDFIVASQKARFSFRQITQSLTPGWGGAAPLLRRVRPSTAMDWLTSGRWIDSQEALNQGLIDCVVSGDKTVEYAQRFIMERSSPLLETLKTLIKNNGRGEEKVFEKLWWSKSHQRAVQSTLKR